MLPDCKSSRKGSKCKNRGRQKIPYLMGSESIGAIIFRFVNFGQGAGKGKGYSENNTEEGEKEEAGTRSTLKWGYSPPPKSGWLHLEPERWLGSASRILGVSHPATPR